MKYCKYVITVLLLITLLFRPIVMLTLSYKILQVRHDYETFSELVVELRTVKPLMTYDCYKTVSPDYNQAVLELGKVSGQPSMLADVKLRSILPNKVRYTYRIKNPNVSADRIFLAEYTFGILRVNKIVWKEIVNVR